MAWLQRSCQLSLITSPLFWPLAVEAHCHSLSPKIHLHLLQMLLWVTLKHFRIYLPRFSAKIVRTHTHCINCVWIDSDINGKQKFAHFDTAWRTLSETELTLNAPHHIFSQIFPHFAINLCRILFCASFASLRAKFPASFPRNPTKFDCQEVPQPLLLR